MAKTVFARTPGGNWSADATWSTTSGGAADTTKPVATDTVYLDANSGQVTVDTASACAIVNCTGYTNTLTLNADITTTGNVTLVAGMTFTPNTSTWNMGSTTAMALSSGGKSFYNLNVLGTKRITLNDAATVTNILSEPTDWQDVTLGGTKDITVGGGLTINGNSSLSTDNNAIRLTGGTLSNPGGSAAGGLYGNFVITGTVTISGVVKFSGALNSTGATLTTTGSTLSLRSGTTKFTDATNIWANITAPSSATLELNQATTISGNLSVSDGQTLTLDTNNISVQGSLTCTGTGKIGGSGRTITLTGTGTWSSGGGAIKTNLVINTAGTITISGTVYYSTGTLTYTAGTVITTDSTLTLTTTSASLATNGISWNNVTTVTSGTFTLTSAMSILGTLTIGSSTILACGTNNVTLAGNLSNNTGTGGITGTNTFIFNGTTTIAGATTFSGFTINAGKTVHLTSTQTFTITGTFNANGSVGNPITLNAVTASSAAHFDVTTVGTVTYVVATDIDSATGSQILDTDGTLLRTVNWILFPTPTVTAIDPNEGPASGGTEVTITGTNFIAGATVTIGGASATDVEVVNSTTITAVTPEGTAGAQDVVVTTSAGEDTLEDGFTYIAPPTVTAIDPNEGPIAGGTEVTITGTDFVSGATVSIGGNPATGVEFVSSTELSATTPEGTAGAKDVVVTNPDTQFDTLVEGFTYIPPPVITDIDPDSGVITGGTDVTITGTDFVSGATVSIGGNPATDVAFISSTTLTAKTPVGTLGPKDVVATNPDTQFDTLVEGFTYTAPTTTARRAQKGLISGYHCFMKQYIDFTKLGLAPLKLPDGKLW